MSSGVHCVPVRVAVTVAVKVGVGGVPVTVGVSVGGVPVIVADALSVAVSVGTLVVVGLSVAATGCALGG